MDKVVELANGKEARVLKMDDANIVLDANNMLAGLQRFIEVDILAVERQERQ